MTANMYAEAKTWNPFVGCRFACTYCVPSFQVQAKRQLHNCARCYGYEPHEHPERLTRIPSAPIVFCCASGDLAFASHDYRNMILMAIGEHSRRRHRRMVDPVEYYLQSKDPSWMLTAPYKLLVPEIVFVTTLETNRDEGYGVISKAPVPSVRWKAFHQLHGLGWKTVLTLEPLLDFDVLPFAEMIIGVTPAYVWLGLNSKPKQVQLPEPSPEKIRELVRILTKAGIEIRYKTTRGLDLSRATVKP